MSAITHNALRVVLADPDPLVRSAVRGALQDSGVRVCGEAADGDDAAGLVRYHRPAVLLCELDLGRVDAAGLIGRLTREAPETAIVVLAADSNPVRALTALRAGARGFLPKTMDLSGLAKALRCAAEGEAIIPRALGALVLEQLRSVPQRGWRPLHSQLTTREWEIIELLDAGADTNAIAEQLVLSPATVYSHIKNILRKLGVHTREQAVHAARRLRPTELHLAA
jgi:DNA-binding NarL/FixJ family response regulator